MLYEYALMIHSHGLPNEPVPDHSCWSAVGLAGVLAPFVQRSHSSGSEVVIRRDNPEFENFAMKGGAADAEYSCCCRHVPVRQRECLNEALALGKIDDLGQKCVPA